MTYKHGVYSNILPSAPAAIQQGMFAVPVYVGTAPVNMMVLALLSVPILVNSLDEAKAAMGYSDDWETFTLCEAMKAHFDNGLGNIGPIVLINVFDPVTHKKTGTTSVTPVGKIAYIDKETVVLSSVAIADQVKGEDFTVEYVLKNGRNQVKITDKTVEGLGTVTVTFDEMDVSKVEEDDVIGTVAASGARTGLQAVDMIYQLMDLIPSVIAAPGWSQTPAIYNAMVAKSQSINGKWEASVAVDIDADSNTTRAAAKAWKITNGYTSERAKVCWPMAGLKGMKFHLSTLAIVAKQTVDAKNSNVPFESPSNKPVDCSGPILADGTAVPMDETDANDLNAVGITTLNKSGGSWRLWGANMGNYSFDGEADILPENMFDATVWMQLYLANTLQESFVNDVDNPGNDRQIQSVCDSAQPWLNGLVAMGALRGGEISYNAAANSSSETVAGRFRYSVRYNDVPPETAITFDVMRDGTLVAGR
jgi:uncharacterized protein